MKKLLVASLSGVIAMLITSNVHAQWGSIFDPPQPLQISPTFPIIPDSGYLRTPSSVGSYRYTRDLFDDIVIDTGSVVGDSFLDRHVGAKVYNGYERYRLYRGLSNGTYLLRRDYSVEVPLPKIEPAKPYIPKYLPGW
ncbi:MAG: hypothetical protein KatS3mg110_0262 [Pirellulaceae bacterium]|nr:MAG: hypothetical protein KatS3mg110_0262 [Pirellulaceae bacterium]